ncbi:MAG: GNAT family N-acetyltransferase [Raineya sp.]|jgi:ribosomal protein S18 acetylase RimI-like enzyme|nr:GNAT family N-acetyltransferase [Raineya sp.]
MIRLATTKDLPIVLYLAQSTFREKWTPIDGEVLVERYILDNMQISHFEQDFSSPNVSFFIAFHESTPVGYAKIIKHSIPQNYEHLGTKFLKIDKLYLLENVQAKGIGSEIMTLIHQIATEELFDTLWLGVWGQNTQAIAFYEKRGFSKAGNWFFQMGDKVFDDEWLMSKAISSGNYIQI